MGSAGTILDAAAHRTRVGTVSAPRDKRTGPAAEDQATATTTKRTEHPHQTGRGSAHRSTSPAHGPAHGRRNGRGAPALRGDRHATHPSNPSSTFNRSDMTGRWAPSHQVPPPPAADIPWRQAIPFAQHSLADGAAHGGQEDTAVDHRKAPTGTHPGGTKSGPTPAPTPVNAPRHIGPVATVHPGAGGRGGPPAPTQDEVHVPPKASGNHSAHNGVDAAHGAHVNDLVRQLHATVATSVLATLGALVQHGAGSATLNHIITSADVLCRNAQSPEGAPPVAAIAPQLSPTRNPAPRAPDAREERAGSLHQEGRRAARASPARSIGEGERGVARAPNSRSNNARQGQEPHPPRGTPLPSSSTPRVHHHSGRVFTLEETAAYHATGGKRYTPAEITAHKARQRLLSLQSARRDGRSRDDGPGSKRSNSGSDHDSRGPARRREDNED